MERHPRQILIPAAGASARFAAEGWQGPKALLTIARGDHCKRMIEYILDELPSWFQPVIVTKKEWMRLFVEAVGDRAKIIGLHGDTLGQSDTIIQGLDVTDHPFYVQNCDVIFQTSLYRRIEAASFQDQTRIVLHQDRRPNTDPPIFSYVDNPRIIKTIREKERISNWAVSGLWRISDPLLFSEAFERHRDTGPRYNGEMYLSDTLTMMNDEKSGFAVMSYEFVDMGTPDAVRKVGGEIVADSSLRS